MPALWTAAEILAATGGEARGLGTANFDEVSIDSRDLAPGALFVAIKGDRFDGHDFVASALERGAGAALVSAAWAAAYPESGRLVVVPDPLRALEDLAAAARARSQAFIVAVTGSAGKTTTKEAIRVALAAAGTTHAAIKSFNNHWGVPLTLARLPRDAKFGVFEIGMNHAGEIAPLTRLVRPHVAVITTVAAAHLAFFPSVAAIAAAKAEIFLGVEPGGTALVNADHAHAGLLVAAAAALGVRVATYGFDPACDWRIAAAEWLEGRNRVEIVHGARRDTFELAARGRHMVANGVAALAVAELAGGDPAAARAALADFSAPAGRGEVTRLGPADRPLLLIDESYNANEASMRAALAVFAETAAPTGKKVLVLGDMLEMGAEGAALHASLAGAALACGATHIFLVGPALGALAPALGERLAGRDEKVEPLLESIVAALALGDALMVKGSNGVRLSLLVERVKQVFSAPFC